MGKKRYNQKDGVGKSKYVISYHDGKKKHKDGSDFFDIQIFRNKKDLAKFVNTLHKGGYKYGFDESVNEDTDVGHQDDEPNMLKSTALEIMEYGKKLMDKLDKYDDMEGEVDFPNWWQSKLTLAKDYLQKAYHYLDSEEKTSETIDRSFRTYRDDEGDDEGPVDESVNEAKLNVRDLPNYIFDDPDDFEDWYNGGMELDKKGHKLVPFSKSDERKLFGFVEDWIESRDDNRYGSGSSSDIKRDIKDIEKFLKQKGKVIKESVNEEFKSNDRTFEKVYGIFDKRDYFNSKGLAKVQIGNFERALKKNDKGAQQILDKFKGDMGKAKDYITQVITDRKKEQAFNDYKAFKLAVDSIQKGKPQYGAVDLVKSRIHNSSQKYSIALYNALRNKKFTKWKDVHNDVDDLIGESVNEGSMDWEKHFKGYNEKELKVISKFIFMNPQGIDGVIKMSKKKDFKPFIKKAAKKGLGESVNEAFVVAYGKGPKPIKPAFAAYADKKMAQKFMADMKRDGYKVMMTQKKIKGIDEDKKQIVQLKKKVGKKEIKFYDALSKLEKKMGKKKYRDFLVKSLKDFKVNGNHYDYRTNAAAEEKLFQLAK